MINYNFKYIYIEITNTCQFSCSFCPKTTRTPKNLSIDEIKHIFNQIKSYTKEIYLHILGEPLLHKDLDEIVNLASQNDLLVNITTNGYLLKESLDKLKKHKNIRKINISLHSMEDISNKTKDINTYLDNIFYSSEILTKNNITVIFRLWNSNLEYNRIIKTLEQKYNTHLKNEKSNLGGIKLSNKIFLSIDNEFDWPITAKDSSDGYCYALKSQIAINSKGDVLPCCLDSEGINILGNIFEEDLESILNKENTLNILNGFRQNKAITELCKRCTYKNRFK